MITKDYIEKLAKLGHVATFPNIAREYFQHVFLSNLSQIPGGEKLLFKGGTALRIVYGSPRFSEDLDFSLFGVSHSLVNKFVEDIFLKILSEIERTGIKVELGKKSGETSGGYFGVASFRFYDYPLIGVEINVSARGTKQLAGEADSIVSDFAPAYSLLHLPQIVLVEEKIFGALLERKKPRDFYDLYFIMRKGMLTNEQKQRLSTVKNKIIASAKKIDFRYELGVFLPSDQQLIVRDFSAVLERELNRQLAKI
ncbi:MAG: hypothetical protein A3J93_03700 [Candidatus Magasanikbacteria bacterium RIFOXYC2_FULL_42_28]|uniref:Nucleotidyl transferase AbiEii/AbiGii toxin family protein n=1 Tax=Candidatus Magasanikbacteria bacterium RIFOXYC2_FULL_42_28 TaxID=1798704 RepID=A0A1F6NUI9_9BACT|nr:MAG: hypothetical protein A3J93_03700 [Candidatus Magasanikbacteria bacterium RIFOXYC2_FULL_42_28]